MGESAVRSGPAWPAFEVAAEATEAARGRKLENRVLLANFAVASNGDGGTCVEQSPGSWRGERLRAAVTAANNNPGPDVITFSIGAATITPGSPLPVVSESVSILAGTFTSPSIELNGSQAGAGANGLEITAGSTFVHGLIINRFGG